MDDSIFSVEDIAEIISFFSAESPFDFAYEKMRHILDRLAIGKMTWITFIEGRQTEAACPYDGSEVDDTEPYSRPFQCNDMMQRTVFIYHTKDAAPWTEKQQQAIQMLTELIFVYGSRFVLHKIAYDAEYVDSETGIPSFKGYARLGMGLIRRGLISQYAALYINVKNCKMINKVFGFRSGTRVLALFSKKCAAMMQEDEIFARLGGDNYVALVRRTHLDELLEKWKDVHVVAELEGKRVPYSFAVRAGIYFATDDVVSVSQLMNASSQAISLARMPHGQDYVFYNTQLEETLLHRTELELAMETAMEQNQYLVYYQPKVGTQSKCLVGAEALIRWEYHGRILSPAEFIPIFEKTGFIMQIDFFVLETVCRQIKKWLAADIVPVPISVNFSRKHLADETLAHRIHEVVQASGIPLELIEIEFTETAYIDDNDVLSKTIAILKRYGISVSMDDFGTGYSSLCLLQDLMFDVLKIDKSLVGNTANERKAIVLENIIGMAKDLQMDIVCEGVETVENLEFLQKTACDMIQGYLFDRPLPLADFEVRLREKQYQI